MVFNFCLLVVIFSLKYALIKYLIQLGVEPCPYIPKTWETDVEGLDIAGYCGLRN